MSNLEFVRTADVLIYNPVLIEDDARIAMASGASATFGETRVGVELR